jgi:hypothetical protein
MLNTMSEAQRLMLREAAKREDRFLQPRADGRAAAVRTLAGRLIDAGWVKEIKARNGAPIWRKDTASGETYALKLTAKGLKAATAMIEATDGESAALVTPAVKKAGTSARRAALLPGALTPASDALGGQPLPIQTRSPRPTSKLGRVLDMLAGDAGATIGELTAATGWLEHTTRAALTGLRHRGYELSRTRKERDSASVYRIVASGGEAAQ